MTSLDAAPRTVVVRPCCIGDCVMALPAIDALAAVAADRQVVVFTGQHSAGVFQNRVTIGSVRVCQERFDAASAFRFGMRDLRTSGADRVVVLDRSRWLRFAASVSRISNQQVLSSNGPELRHETEAYLDVVRSMGIDITETLPRIVPAAVYEQQAEALIPPDNAPFAVVHPGGGENPGSIMLQKRWPAERFADVARWLTSQGFHVLVTGSHTDRELCREVADTVQSRNVRIIAGQANLMTNAAVLRRSSVYVGSDTGISHIAAAVGAPVVVVFGPTNPARYRPLGRQVTVLCPEESWGIADADLRRPLQHQAEVSVERVSSADVIDAIDRSLFSSSDRAHE